MAKYFGVIYWSGMILVMSLILISVMGSFGAALFLSIMLLPGVLFVKYFSRDISFSNRKKGVLHTIYFIIISLLIEYMAIILVYWCLYGFDIPKDATVMQNPVLIWFLLASMISIEKLVEAKLLSETPKLKFVSFISDRRKVSLESGSITYIESKDYEVFVHTVSGDCHQTRMKISQWESLLDDRFMRVHRAFIVNREHISRFDNKAVYIGNFTIEISRKYKETVSQELKTDRS